MHVLQYIFCLLSLAIFCCCCFFACLLAVFIFICSDTFSKCLNKMIEFLTRSIKRIQHYLLVSISLLVLLIQANSTGYRTCSLQIGQAVVQNLFDDVLYANNLYNTEGVFFSITRQEKEKERQRDVIQWCIHKYEYKHKHKHIFLLHFNHMLMSVCVCLTWIREWCSVKDSLQQILLHLHLHFHYTHAHINHGRSKCKRKREEEKQLSNSNWNIHVCINIAK